MNTNGNKPLEEELRSSQLYQALRGSGIPVADKIAQGLGKAAEELDSALNNVSPVVKRTAGRRDVQGSPSGWSPVGNRAAAQRSRTTQTVGQGQPPKTPPRQAGHSYSYHYSAPTGTPNAGGQAVPPSPAPGARPGQRPSGVNPAPAPQMPRMKVVRRGSPAKFYITGAAAVLYALNFPLYEPVHFLIFGLVLAGAFLLSSKLFRGKKELVPEEPPKPREEAKKEEQKEKEKEEKSSTGNPEVDKLIDSGREYLRKLKAANDAIPDEALSEDIARMEKASADIFRFISDHPEKAPQIRKFMNYYLPTTLKLLGTYQRLASQSVKGENITSTMFNIAGMMHTVADAFEKQLDSLFSDEAMDVSADISVFETLLKQEGFVGEEPKKAVK